MQARPDGEPLVRKERLELPAQREPTAAQVLREPRATPARPVVLAKLGLRVRPATQVLLVPKARLAHKGLLDRPDR